MPSKMVFSTSSPTKGVHSYSHSMKKLMGVSDLGVIFYFIKDKIDFLPKVWRHCRVIEVQEEIWQVSSSKFPRVI